METKSQRDRNERTLLLIYLSKLQEIEQSLIQKQENLNELRKSAVKSWERQRDSVVKIFNDVKNNEKIIYSATTKEKKEEIAKIQGKRDHLRRYLADQRIILERQQKLDGELPKMPLFSDFHKRKSRKREKILVEKGEDKIHELEMLSYDCAAKIEQLKAFNEDFDKEIEIQLKRNNELKEKQQKLNNQEPGETKESLMEERKKLYSSCIGEEELKEENAKLKKELEELKKIPTSSEEHTQEMMKHPPFDEDDPNEFEKINQEIANLRFADKEITENFFKLKDTVQGLSRMSPIDSFIMVNSK